MSAWRVLITDIYRNGPSRIHLGDAVALREARRLNLLEFTERQQWRLTPLGLDVCEGRVITTRVRPGGMRFVATWLRALPRGLRFDLN